MTQISAPGAAALRQAFSRDHNRAPGLAGEFRARRLILASGGFGFAGVVERRGEGLLAEAHEPRAVLRLVIDLPGRGRAPPRWPEEEGRGVELLGVRLPRLALDLAPGLQEGAYAALRGLDRVA